MDERVTIGIAGINANKLFSNLLLLTILSIIKSILKNMKRHKIIETETPRIALINKVFLQHIFTTY